MENDRTRAKALEIAERRLLALSHEFSAEDVGEAADAIIGSMIKAEIARLEKWRKEDADT